MKDTHWLDDAANVRRLWRSFLAVLALSVLAEPFVDLHPQFAIEGRFAFSAWYGLLACLAMIAVAKALGFVLKRDDTYYDDRGYGATGSAPGGATGSAPGGAHGSAPGSAQGGAPRSAPLGADDDD